MNGHDRERQVRKLLEKDGWWVCRAAGSLGDADLVALRGGWELQPTYNLPERLSEAQMIEVKANKDGGPYANFRPSDRAELLAAAEKAGAEAVLCYWPAHKQPRWISAADWPPVKERTPNA